MWGNKALMFAHKRGAGNLLACVFVNAKVICFENKSLSFALSIPGKKLNHRLDAV